MKSNIFREAAETLYIDEDAACLAIKFGVQGQYSITKREKALDFFVKRFKPPHLEKAERWFGALNRKKNRNARALALLLCAEMTKELEALNEK